MSDCAPISELILDELDAVSGLDQLEACLPWLEKVYVLQREGGAANFPLIRAATPRGATIFHSAGWADADDAARRKRPGAPCWRQSRRRPSTKNTDVIAAGLSLLLGREGRGRAATRCRRGS